jgi:hypothetical protein
MSIYNWNCYFPPMDKCQCMIKSASFEVLRSYFDHTLLVGTVCYTNVFMNVLSASFCHREVIIWNSWGVIAIYILLRFSVSNISSLLGTRVPSGMKKTEI